MALSTNELPSNGEDNTTIPGLSTGIAVQSGEASKDDFYIQFAKEFELYRGKGARSLAFRHAALRHAQSHLFGGREQVLPIPALYPPQFGDTVYQVCTRFGTVEVTNVLLLATQYRSFAAAASRELRHKSRCQST
jgi:hypothetical protein